MTEEPTHFNPPIRNHGNRDKFVNNAVEFRDWVRIDVTSLYQNKDDAGLFRKKINAEAKKWCVHTTRNDWYIYQQVKIHSGWVQNTKVIHTYFCFSDKGEATLFRLTFGGDVV